MTMRLGENPSRHPGYVRRTVRRTRKLAKRAHARGLVAWLRLRNLMSTVPVHGDANVVVSLTSYGTRIDTVALAIESIARGTIRPRKLILWLDESEIFARLPVNLVRLQRRGLEILRCDNLGPHSKYYPYVETTSEAERLPLATADDDVLYPQWWLQTLYEGHQAHPDMVNCHWASIIGVNHGKITRYTEWARCKDASASVRHFATGVSGVLYPPALLEELALRAREFLEHTPRADDIWLHWVALQAGFTIRQVSPRPRHFPLLPGTQGKTLAADNVEGSGNDLVIAKLYSARDIERIETADKLWPMNRGKTS